MRIVLSLLFIFLFVMFVGVASAGYAGDEGTIMRGLMQNSGGTYVVPAGTYEIDGQIIVPRNTNMIGTVSDDGEILTRFVLGNKFYLGKMIPIIMLRGNNDISYISIDGNSDNRDGAPSWKGYSGKENTKKTGYGSDNFFGCSYAENIRVHHCIMKNGLGDGFRVFNSQNIEFDHNKVERLGHDVFYATRSEFIEAHDNVMEIRSNSALRGMDVYSVRFFDNVITCGNEYSGPAIQIQNDKGRMGDIEICGNVIRNSCGPGFWIVGKTSDHEQNAYIHHNVIYSAGWNPSIVWVGGVICSGFSNLVLENNVFDGSYKCGIGFYLYQTGWEQEGSAVIRNNIITNTKVGGGRKQGGWGVWNNIGSNQQVKSTENCYYGNAGGNVKGVVSQNNDITSNPRTSSTMSDWTWDGTKWKCSGYNMTDITGEIDGVSDGDSVYDGLDPITEEEAEQFEFMNPFSILNVKYESNLNLTSIMPAGYKSTDESNVTSYNNTYNPQSRYFVNTDNFTTKVVYEYKGNVSVHYLNTKYSATGLSGYENIDMWELEGETNRIDDLFVIPEAVNDSYNPVSITVYDAGGHKTKIEKYNIKMYNEKLTNAINPIAYYLMAILGILIGGIVINVNTMIGKYRRTEMRRW